MDKLIILLAISITGIRTFGIKLDDMKRAMIEHEIEHVNVLKIRRSITYGMDLTIWQEVNEHFDYINKTCQADVLTMRLLKKKLSEMKKLENGFRTGEEVTEILGYKSFTYVNLIEKELNSFLNKSNINRCKIAKTMTQLIVTLTADLDRLTRNDYSTLNLMVSLNDIREDAMEILKMDFDPKLKIPFDFTVNFYKDFVENSIIEIDYNKDVIYMTFKIPVYDEFNAFSLYPKPLKINGSWYMLNDTSEYLLRDHNKTIIYTYQDMDELCFEYKREKYCEIPRDHRKCDDEYIKNIDATKISKGCFSSFPELNAAIQVYNDMYFNVLQPLTLDANCGDGNYVTYLNYSAKIENLTNCHLKTYFFEYDHKYNELPYKIYMARQIFEGEQIIDEQFYGSNHLVIGLMTIIITIVIIMCKVINEIKKQQYFQEVTFYVNARDTDV